MLTRLFFHWTGARNVLRYHPIPDGKYPPPAPVAFFGSGAPSMLQSCGRSTVRQGASLKEGAEASVGSPRKNFQLESARSTCRPAMLFAAAGDCAFANGPHAATLIHASKQTTQRPVPRLFTKS